MNEKSIRTYSTIPKGWESLVQKARAVRDNAYAPYSAFKVGCAIESETGSVFVGCNVENSSYPGTICAERAAVVQMVASGDKKIKRLAIITSSNNPCFPCGECRQVLWEFGRASIILSSNVSGTHLAEAALDVLLPLAFGPEDLSHRDTDGLG